MQANAQISTPNVAVREQLGSDTLDRGHRDDKSRLPRPEYWHAKQAALAVDDEAAFRAVAEPHVETDQVVDISTAHALPRPAGNRNHSQVRNDPVLATAQGKDHLADARCIAHCHSSLLGQVVAEAQHGDVGGRIPASELRRDGFAGGGDHRNVVVGLERVAGGDDNAWLPDEPACHQASMQSYAHHGVRCSFCQMLQLPRQGQEGISGRLLGHRRLRRLQSTKAVAGSCCFQLPSWLGPSAYTGAETGPASACGENRPQGRRSRKASIRGAISSGSSSWMPSAPRRSTRLSTLGSAASASISARELHAPREM